MGCRMSRTISQPDLASPTSGDLQKMKENITPAGMIGIPIITNGKESPRTIQGRITNGNSILSRRDTPAGSLLDAYSNRNGQNEEEQSLIVTGTKPISQVESASQADFFRMLDEKIAQRVDDYEDPAEVLRLARLAVKEANNRAMRMQNNTTQQLVQRVKDLKYWSGEIDRELQDLREDNDDLQRYFRKLRTCAGITGEAMKCNEACNAVRRKRIHVDANDRVDSALAKEKDTISDCMKQIKEFHGIIEKQIDINDESKNRLMRDFTLKQEAVSLDHRAAAVAVDSKYLLRKGLEVDNLELRDVGPLQRMSEYQEWVENTAANLNTSAKARTRSRKIVARLVGTTRDLAQAMRQEAINVENTLKDSIRVWNEWRDSLQAQLNAKDKDMKVADAAIAEIDVALKLKGSPLQVALARQSQRCLRPGIELCNDKAQHALQAELNNLKSSMLSLELQLDKAKESRRKLDGDRFKIQRKLEICQQNIAVDYEILRQIRSTYPQEIQLSGFLVGELPKAIVK